LFYFITRILKIKEVGWKVKQIIKIINYKNTQYIIIINIKGSNPLLLGFYYKEKNYNKRIN